MKAIKKIIPIALIVFGIILILLPYLSDLIVKLKNKEALAYINGISPDKMQKNLLNDADFDFNNVKDISLSSTLLSSAKLDPNLIIGQLVIPDINLNLPVVKGLSDTNLLAGIGTMKKDQIMGKGNYSLAGHHMRRKDTLFGGLMDIKRGSLVKITDKKIVYEYVIYETKVVPDTAVEMISDDISKKKGKPIISLMTCFRTSSTGKRFFAMGELVREYPYDEATFAQR